MPSVEAAGRPVRRLPARRPTARRIVWRSRIQTQARDHRESMAVPRIDGDPFSMAAVPVDPKFLRVHRDADETGAGQRVGNRPGTIVGGIVKGFMAAAKSIRLGPQLV